MFRLTPVIVVILVLVVIIMNSFYDFDVTGDNINLDNLETVEGSVSNLDKIEAKLDDIISDIISEADKNDDKVFFDKNSTSSEYKFLWSDEEGCGKFNVPCSAITLREMEGAGWISKKNNSETCIPIEREKASATCELEYGKITIVLTTSMSGKDPDGSIERMKEVLSTLRENPCLSAVPVIIACDGFPIEGREVLEQILLTRYNTTGKKHSRGEFWTPAAMKRYEMYKERLREMFREPTEPWAANVTLIEFPELKGPLQTTYFAIQKVETPYLLLTQHDYVFKKSSQLDVHAIVTTLEKNPYVKSIITDRIPNFWGWCGGNHDPRRFCPGPLGLQLTRARCFVDGPQFTSREHYLSTIAPVLQDCINATTIRYSCFFTELKMQPNTSSTPWEKHSHYGIWLMGESRSGAFAKQI